MAYSIFARTGKKGKYAERVVKTGGDYLFGRAVELAAETGDRVYVLSHEDSAGAMAVTAKIILASDLLALTAS
jgi:hypothetical protein